MDELLEKVYQLVIRVHEECFEKKTLGKDAAYQCARTLTEALLADDSLLFEFFEERVKQHPKPTRQD